MATEVVVKKWGNSIGLVLPKEIVKEKKIKENDRIMVEIVNKANITNLFGSLKRKMKGQEFKDMVREGW